VHIPPASLLFPFRHCLSTTWPFLVPPTETPSVPPQPPGRPILSPPDPVKRDYFYFYCSSPDNNSTFTSCPPLRLGTSTPPFSPTSSSATDPGFLPRSSPCPSSPRRGRYALTSLLPIPFSFQVETPTLNPFFPTFRLFVQGGLFFFFASLSPPPAVSPRRAR